MTQLAGYFEPLIKASVGVASKLKDHQQQMTFLDQTKTLAESALQMLYAAKEGGGNPKASSCLCSVSCITHVVQIICLSVRRFINWYPSRRVSPDRRPTPTTP